MTLSTITFIGSAYVRGEGEGGEKLATKLLANSGHAISGAQRMGRTRTNTKLTLESPQILAPSPLIHCVLNNLLDRLSNIGGDFVIERAPIVKGVLERS